MADYVTLNPDFDEAFEFGLSRKMNPIALAWMTPEGFKAHGFRAYQRLAHYLDAVETTAPDATHILIEAAKDLPAAGPQFAAFYYVAQHDASLYKKAGRWLNQDTFQPLRGGNDIINRYRAILITYNARTTALASATALAANALAADFVVGLFVLDFLARLNMPVDTTLREIDFMLKRGDTVPQSMTDAERQQDLVKQAQDFVNRAEAMISGKR